MGRGAVLPIQHRRRLDHRRCRCRRVVLDRDAGERTRVAENRIRRTDAGEDQPHLAARDHPETDQPLVDRTGRRIPGEHLADHAGDGHGGIDGGRPPALIDAERWREAEAAIRARDDERGLARDERRAARGDPRRERGVEAHGARRRWLQRVAGSGEGYAPRYYAAPPVYYGAPAPVYVAPPAYYYPPPYYYRPWYPAIGGSVWYGSGWHHGRGGWGVGIGF